MTSRSLAGRLGALWRVCRRVLFSYAGVNGFAVYPLFSPLSSDGAFAQHDGNMCGFFSSNKATSDAVACRNGSIRKGDRVQTQYEREEGGDDKWYCGVVTEAYTNGKVRAMLRATWPHTSRSSAGTRGRQDTAVRMRARGTHFG